MADFNEIFQDSGLDGVIPYAFGLRGKGYDFLRKKLLSGAPFWILMSDATKAPFYSAIDEKVYFNIYGNEDMALKRCDELAIDKMYCTPSLVEVGEFAPNVMKRYRDLGINYLLVNDSVWVSMGDMAPAATYDGMLTSSTPLRNATLNAALYTTMQYIEAEIPCDALIAYFWDIFKKSHFIVPVSPKADLKPSQALSIETTEPHILSTEAEENYLAVFTDPDFLALYGEAYGIESKDRTAVFTPMYSDLMEYLQEQPLNGIYLNCGYGDFALSHELMKEFDIITLNQQANAAD